MATRRPGKAKRNQPRREAAEARRLVLTGEVSVELLEAGADGAAPLPRISIDAYSGGIMKPVGAWGDVVVDLTGVKVPAGGKVPILKDHDHSQIVGHATVVIGNTIRAEGVISGTGPAAQEVVGAAKNEFPWKASVGLAVEKSRYLSEDENAQVNGQSVSGPLLIVQRSLLGEISVLPWPADQSTSVEIAASHNRARRPSRMKRKFTQWLKANGFTPAQLSAQQLETLEATWSAAQQTPPEQPLEANQNESGGNQPKGDPPADPIKARREMEAAETERVAEIRTICAGRHTQLEAQAIREGWDATKVELHVLRAERESAPAISVQGSDPASVQVLEAAAALAGGLEDAEKRFDAKTLEAAEQHFPHGIGLQELLIEASMIGGYRPRRFRGYEREILQAAFSTKSLSGILSNTANKFLLEGFMGVESAWREIAERVPASDFKTLTSYRMTGDLQFEEVGPAGEIKHGEVDEESYTNQAKTYAKMFAITRTDLVNDDLGALTAVPRRIGRGAALGLNHVFWTAFMDNSSFFTSGRGNYISGATTVLDATGLKAGVTAFRKLTDADGKPIGAVPRILLVPPDLEVEADEFFVSTNINTATADTTTPKTIQRQPSRNVFLGKYRPVVSTYLSNTSYTGYSTTAWYLLADPRDMATIQVAFLNGRETPVVESADADFNVLGVQMRGYFDFGCAKTEYRAGVKSKGAA